MSHTIRHLIDVNGDNFYNFINIKVGDEVVKSFKGNSFTGPFLNALFSMMSGNPVPSVITGGDTVNRFDFFPLVPDTGDVDAGVFKTITNVADSGLPDNFVRLTIINHGFPASILAQVRNVRGLTTPVNGPQPLARIDADTFDIPVTFGGSWDASYPATIHLMVEGTGWKGDETCFSTPKIRVGLSDVANTVDQRTLNDEMGSTGGGDGKGQMHYGAVSISTPSVTATESIITLSCTITNNSQQSETLEEIGVYTRFHRFGVNDNSVILIARDLIPGGLVLTASQSATVEFQFITKAVSTGGILIQFNEVLYRLLTGLDREAKTINNENAIEDDSDDTFLASGTGGNNRNLVSSSFDTNPGEEGQTLGPQVGTSTSVVAVTDFDLGARVLHGVGAGQLLHAGAFVDFMRKDAGSIFWEFDIISAFLNNSGGTITINEVGLNFGVRAFTSYMKWVHAMARHQVSPGVAIDDDEALQVIYTLRAQL